MSEQVVIDREREPIHSTHFSIHLYTVMSVMASQKINFIHFREHVGNNSWLYHLLCIALIFYFIRSII